jgi:hypothetical protein
MSVSVVGAKRRSSLRFIFSYEMLMGAAMGAIAVAVVALLAAPLERLRPDIRQACNAAFTQFTSAGDMVSLERTRISMNALNCDLRGRLLRSAH